MDILMTTTSLVEGRPVKQYYGVVSGEAIIGANVVRDFLPVCAIFLVDVLHLMKMCCGKPRIRH